VSENVNESETPETTEKKKSLFRRMKEGLSRSTKNLSDGITGIFTKKKLDAAALEDLEDLLIGAATTRK